MNVCGECGVDVGENRVGKLIHLAEIPKGYESHDVVAPADREAFEAAVEARLDVRVAAEELIAHHASMHPLDGCEWAAKLLAAVRAG